MANDTSFPRATAKAARAPQAATSRDRAEGGDGRAGIRVLCVEDHAVLVEGLKAHFAIENRIRIVGRLSSAENLIDDVERLRPDIVLLDIEMPGPDIFEMADRMRRRHPNLRFVFLSAHIRDGYLAAAYKCGAWGYFAKGDDLDDIEDGIKELAASASGAFVMGPKVKQRCGQVSVVSPTSRPAPLQARPKQDSLKKGDGSPATPLDSLSGRELEVLRLIGKGLSRVEIARELSRSAKTIDGHQDRLMRKLGVETRAELMRFAIREGLSEA